MLVYFKVRNYKSIKEQVTISFAATSVTEHQESNVMEKGKLKLLKSVLLYGPNASGKSKILDAFVTYRQLILGSTLTHSTRLLPMFPFKYSLDTLEQPSSFESEFIIDNKRYRYGFEADRVKVISEWLLEVKATTESYIFLRMGQEFKVNYKKFVNAENLEQRCNPNALFLSVGDQWNVELAKDIYKWFDGMYNISGLSDIQHQSRTNELIENPEYREIINNMMRHADLGINSIDVVRSKVDWNEEYFKNIPTESETVYAIHNVYDGDGNITATTAMHMEQNESEGTKKFYNILGSLLYAVKNGYFVVIDEMDARFHTLLTKAIIRLFNSAEVKTGAQLFAVSHDTAVMDNELLRRDQIYLVEKNNVAATQAVNLVEYKSARKETPISKNYLEGRYGGIPFIDNLENFLNNGEGTEE
jgi:AAA15 family ATPase/GTPase